MVVSSIACINIHLILSINQNRKTMKPLSFPEQTTVIEKSIHPNCELPIAVRFQNPNDLSSVKKFTSKYTFSDLEFEQLKATRTIYISQFGDSVNHVLPQVDSPFLVYKVHFRSLGNRVYDFFLMSDSPEEGSTEVHRVRAGLENCIFELTQYLGCQPDQLLFEEFTA
jgi:hypothetical protein